MTHRGPLPAVFNDRCSALRAIAFAAVAAGVLGLVGWQALNPTPRAPDPRRSEMYRHAGDTYVDFYYVTGGNSLLSRAAGYYRLAAEADPQNVRALASAGLALQELGDKRGARRQMIWAVLRAPDSEKPGLRALLALVMPAPAMPDQIDAARPFAVGLAPGHLALAGAYKRIGLTQDSQRELAAGRRRGHSLLPFIIIMISVCGIILLAGIAGLNIGLYRLLSRRKASASALATLPRPPWGVREAVEALILWLAAGLALGLAAARFRPAGDSAPVLVLTTVLTGLVPILWLRLAARGKLDLGWRLERPWRRAAVGVAAAGVATPALLVLHQFLKAHTSSAPMDHPLVPLLVTAPGWASKALLAAALCLIVPVLEETVFRGILFRGLRQRWSFAPAAVLSATVFAFGHGSLPGFAPYVLLGILLSWLYERTGSLVGPTAAHASFNALNLAWLLPFLR